MNPTTLGLIGGIGGSVIGLIGGLIGTYVSIRKTRSAAERTFVKKAALVMWLMLLGLVALPLTLTVAGIFPKWGYYPPFLLFFIFLGPFIREINKRQMALRNAEGGSPG